MGIFIYTLFRWRSREEQLKEAFILLEAQKAQLVRAESLAAVGSLVTGAAHELRNPLGSSGAVLQSLKDDIATSPTTSEVEKKDALESIDMALRGQKRAGAIVERLYQLTDELALAGDTRPAKYLLDAVRQKYPQVRIHENAEAGEVLLPQRAAVSVLFNLLDNAVGAGGSEPPELSFAVEHGWLSVFVSDSGRGIPKAQQAEVFKPFFTGQKAGAGHGVGLGLYIVHELATRMGGRVELESEEGKGTQVTVRVPLSPK